MKCKKNLLSMLLALVMILGIFAGCGATPASGGASSAAAPDKAPAASAAETTNDAPAAPADKQITVGVSVATATNNPHIVSVVNSLIAALEAQGWTTDLQDADGDASKQSTQFDTLVTKNVDLIVYWLNQTPVRSPESVYSIFRTTRHLTPEQLTARI